MLADIHGEDQAAYRERIVQYVDSVFSEVGNAQCGLLAIQDFWWANGAGLTC
ncbi:hypothetical protein BKA56DRAFT_599730 [Ilyonectria sp. MPI-CAGE-AT-0026]|nr:hypothetical protein BKA56DRAFT_599730 [Ilyonectria sp. MPI-CAGE-AT-0026]